MDKNKPPLFQISKALTEKKKPEPVKNAPAASPATGKEEQVITKKVIKKKRLKPKAPPKEGEFRISSSLFDDEYEIEYEEVYVDQKGNIVDPPKKKVEEDEEEEHSGRIKKEKEEVIEINLIGKAYGLCCRLSTGAMGPALEAAKAPTADMTHAVKVPPSMAGDMKLLLKNALEFVDKQIKKNPNNKGMWTITIKNLKFAIKRV